MYTLAHVFVNETLIWSSTLNVNVYGLSSAFSITLVSSATPSQVGAIRAVFVPRVLCRFCLEHSFVMVVLLVLARTGACFRVAFGMKSTSIPIHVHLHDYDLDFESWAVCLGCRACDTCSTASQRGKSNLISEFVDSSIGVALYQFIFHCSSPYCGIFVRRLLAHISCFRCSPKGS